MGKLEELVGCVLKNGIHINEVRYDEVNDTLVYCVTGFSKSGIGELYVADNGDVMCKTRYGQKDKIDTFDDLVRVAYGWNKCYCNSYGWDEQWIPHFEKAGLIKTNEIKTIQVTPIY